ncbi:hypothetical protein E2542_SST25046 [Spatholobus suberectus]|nr:hypothetical protein E2542_SST25046 [Spatholobus suberectus]
MRESFLWLWLEVNAISDRNNQNLVLFDQLMERVPGENRDRKSGDGKLIDFYPNRGLKEFLSGIKTSAASMASCNIKLARSKASLLLLPSDNLEAKDQVSTSCVSVKPGSSPVAAENPILTHSGRTLLKSTTSERIQLVLFEG